MIFFKSFKKPRIVCFDLDDTLYDNTFPISYAEQYMLEAIGERYLGGDVLSPNSYTEIKNIIIDRCPEIKDDVSMVRYFAYRHILDNYGYERKQSASIAGSLVDEFIKVRSRINVPETSLETLRIVGRYYHLVALSNGNADMNCTSLRNCFENIWMPISGISAKPAPDLFIIASSYYRVAPNEMLFVGDDPQNDVYGAVRFGCQMCWQTQYRKPANELIVLPHVMISNIRELIDLLL